MTPLLLAKAPVPGRVKTRLGADVGLDTAADLAAAALLDTIDLVREAFPDAEPVLALDGDLAEGCRSAELLAAVAGWRVVPQRGEGFGARLAHAHAQVSGPVVQIAMDTPHLHPTMLAGAAAELDDHEGVIGPAEDGGWWLLGLVDPSRAGVLNEVPMSRADTGELTRQALGDLDLATAATTYDVDTVVEAGRAAADAPQTRFAAAWRSHLEVTR